MGLVAYYDLNRTDAAQVDRRCGNDALLDDVKLNELASGVRHAAQKAMP